MTEKEALTTDPVIPLDRTERHAMMATILRAAIAGQIRGLRQARKLGQRDVAMMMGVAESSVSRWEDPCGEWMTVQTLRKIAGFYDVALRINFVGWREFMETYCNGTPPIPSPFSQEGL